MAVALVSVGCVGDDSERAPVEPVAPLTEPPDTEATATTTTTTAPASTTTTTTTAPVEARYVFPLEPASVADFGPTHHDYPATDIFAPEGTVVVAVTDGVVDFVSREDTWEPATDDPVVRGGLSVAIVGDDGVRYYGSHLLSVDPGIEPGARVTAGQRLGLSGRSGNARDTDPHLHFGISHPTTPEDWAVRRGEIDPVPYLEAWRRGEHLSPADELGLR
ncbi:MAG TPA: M23 family metallopeptidase [Acidimicrobiales bacterium]|nr:M23 family metallopeptidase [Acidimicrobiales bacterium]